MDPLRVPAPQETKLHFLDYWRIIRIRKTVILAVFLLVVITATLVTFILPESFSSTARIKIERDATDIDGLGARMAMSGYDPYFIQTEFEVIQSEIVLGKVIKDLNLNEEWGKKYGNTLKTPETMGLLKQRIDLRPVRNTSFIEIRVFSDKPEEAAKIANAVAEAYREHRQNQRKQLSSGGIAALEDRWKQQEATVREAQATVDRLREELKIPDMVLGGDQPMPLMSAETLRRIEGMRIERKAMLAGQETLVNKLKELREKLGPGGLAEAITTAVQDAQLSSLLEQLVMAEQALIRLEKEYGPGHTEVLKIKGQTSDLHNKITNRVDGILSGLDVRVSSAREELANMERDLEKALTNDIQKAKSSRPYFDAKRTLEEAQRFRQLLGMKIEAEKIDQNLPKTMMVTITDPAYPGMRPV